MSNKKMISRRDFLRTTSLGAVGLALVACAAPAAPGAQTSGGEAAPPDEKVTIRFHARIGTQEDTLYDMQMPKFMEEHPNIELVKESFPGAEYSAKLSTMMAGCTLGDVSWSALGQSKIFFDFAQNVIRPVDELVQSGNVDLSQWYEGCINAITHENQLLGLPFKAHPGLAVIYYNQTAFEEAGLDIPTTDWTIEEQLAAAQALTKQEGDQTTFYGYLPSTSWKAFVTLMRAFGAELINEDGTQFELDSEIGYQATQWLYDFFQTHRVAPTPEEMLGFGDSPGNQMWASGLLGMYQGGTSVSVLDSTIGDSFEWMALPNAIGPGGVGGSDYEVDAYCVTTATEHPTEAFEWVQYLCNRESGVQLGLIGGTVGGRPDVYGAPELLEFEFRRVFKDIMDNAMDSRICANWRQEEAETTFAQLTQPLWAGDEEPTPAFIDSVAAQIQDIMDKPRP
jgi:multiple sugar transport system substrate-binding protein